MRMPITMDDPIPIVRTHSIPVDRVWQHNNQYITASAVLQLRSIHQQECRDSNSGCRILEIRRFAAGSHSYEVGKAGLEPATASSQGWRLTARLFPESSPGRARTCDTLLRRQMLYPSELRASGEYRIRTDRLLLARQALYQNELIPHKKQKPTKEFGRRIRRRHCNASYMEFLHGFAAGLDAFRIIVCLP